MVDIDATRVRPPTTIGERAMLDAWIGYHRATLLGKCVGLTDGELRERSVAPSDMSLLGLVRHLTEVERGWFSDFAGRQYWGPYSTLTVRREWDVDDADVEASFAAYRAECAASDAAVAGRGLDDTHTDEEGRTFSLRWVYLHMIEEYARHNGHADLLRERIDGMTGE